MATESQQLALDTIARRPTKGIPTFLIHIMDTDILDELAGVPPGTYLKQPEETYLKVLWNVGVNALDQYIPTNPLSMGKHGYESGTAHGATTGLEEIVLDGMKIDSPEAVVEHMEKFVFPRTRQSIKDFDEERTVQNILKGERDVQQKLGPSILKTCYGWIPFPGLRYFTYGYANYFMAYALYPEVMEKDFSLQADYCVLHNRAAARAIVEGKLAMLYRLDHDMADSRGTLPSIRSLEKIWFPHFERSIRPVVNTGMNLIWHCDGNLMAMVPLLLEAGIKGFQGFQYEAGMDYEKICKLRARDGDTMIIVAGVSVTRTLPFGTPDDVRREMEWLVKCGPRTGLFLAGSSSCTPSTPRENILTWIEGLKYYREHGRG